MKFDFIPELSYRAFLKLQNQLLQEAQTHLGEFFHSKPKTENERTRINEIVLFCEHPLVLTAGISTKPGEKIEAQRQAAQLGAEFYQTDRGGKLAIHGPGQLMIYPLVCLKDPLQVRQWVGLLLEATKASLKRLIPDIQATQKPDGLYTPKGKLCFAGIRVHRIKGDDRSIGFSTHGLALNLYNELQVYQHFTACGVKNRPVDSLWQEKPENTTSEIQKFIEVWLFEFVRCLS
jgi:lipoyl(octanoyl) transferase